MHVIVALRGQESGTFRALTEVVYLMTAYFDMSYLIDIKLFRRISKTTVPIVPVVPVYF